VQESENGRLVRFLKRADCLCAFRWNICDKNCNVIRCIESDSFQGYVYIHKSWEDNINEEEQWAKSTLTERDHRTLRRIVSKNHTRTTAQVAGELNIHLANPVSTRTAPLELYKSIIHGRVAIAKPLKTERNEMRKR
jgi:hypothetical protein